MLSFLNFHLYSTMSVQVITRGIACATPNCKTRMHSHCFASYRKRHAACPACKESWPGTEARGGAKGKDKGKGIVSVGEDAFVDGQDQRRRVRRTQEDEDEEEEEQGDGEDASQMQTQESSQPSRTQDRRKRKNAKMMVDDDDDDDDEEAPTQPHRKGRR